jgi:branched-chain amino acid aminotransferase
MIGDWVHVAGSMRQRDEAVVSVFDHGFLYGDGVFEGIAVVKRSIFKLNEHLDRLLDSANYLRIDAPGREDILAAVLETARRNSLDEGYLRVVLTRGAGPVGIRNMDKLGAPTLVVIAQHETRAARASVYENGLRAVVSSVRRVPPQCVDGKAKTCNYINNILAYLEARHAGADTAILLDTEGYVAEDYAANLFVVVNRTVKTPILGSILNGITRQTLLQLCRDEGRVTMESRLTTHDLYCADEVFETGSLAEVKPITSIGGRPIGFGCPGPVTQELHRGLRELMESGSCSVRYE